MIIAPFYHKKMTLLEVCLLHSQGFVFHKEGIESLKIEGIPNKVLLVYIDESTLLTDFYDSFFRMLETENKGRFKHFRGMILSSGFMADLLLEPDDTRLFKVARASTLHKEVDSKTQHALLGVCTDKNISSLQDMFETPSVQFNFKRAFQNNCVMVLVRSDQISKTSWICDPVLAYQPKIVQQ